MKKSDFLKELRGMNVADLREKARVMGEELMKLRFRNAASQFGESHKFTQLRRGIAQLMTVLRQQRAA